MVNLKYLITGTGRCGTVYLARFLTSLGIPCGHESIFDWQGCRGAEKRLLGEEKVELSFVSQASYNGKDFKDLDDWIDLNHIEAESSYMSAPFLGEDILRDIPVIHVVRNPIKVVNSFCNYIDYFKSGVGTNSYEQFIYRHIPELKEDMNQYDRACLYYVLWNEMIEKHDVFFHRIEDDKRSLLDFVGVSGNYFDDNSINTLKKVAKNKFASPTQIENQDIQDRFVEIGIRYGYNMSLRMMVI
jgi:hypothetical protein